ncbi:hypothetical protein [Chryseobacterium sp. 2987]|uniref:hypothetical protein n=1 Tax=Chryseobacterium sp. 2987 TaxID=2817767 RepID=UPI0028543900|nr:hypothetical protein [Chryseobacterium sp. 2987]MDR6919400.1 hypothetical protein [Chryseobacterium sp. 2987]
MNLIDNLKSNAFIEFAKEHSTLIIAIPYIIGGLRQLFRLLSISFDLIIFFSFTQLLIDGIITILKMVVLLSYVQLYKSFLDKKTNSGELKALKQYSIILGCLFAGVVGTVIYFKTVVGNLPYAPVFQFSVFLLLILLSINLVISLKDSPYKGAGYSMIFVFLVFIPMPVSSTNHIDNIDTLSNSLKTEYKDAKIVYYNDQYLFYKINPKDSADKILVVKIDKLFDDVIYNGQKEK